MTLSPAPSTRPSAASLNEETTAELAQFAAAVKANVAHVVVGMDHVVDQLLLALIVGGHVLLEGVPGTAKTSLAKAIAHSLGIEYQRVQFTPDLLPSDITGTYVFDRKTDDFVLRRGPIFCQLLLADEVNRAPAKTQSALLEAMQESQVTIEGTTLPLPQPFIVLATQNPIEQEGVYRLPEAQLDRFLVRVEMGYPPRSTEVDILKLHSGLLGGAPSGPGGALPMPQAVFSPERILGAQSLLALVYAEPTLLQYIVDLSRATREHPDVALGASPRASLYLLQCGKARALLQGRQYLTHEDVQSVAPSVLGHRLILRPEAEVEGRRIADVLTEILEKIPILP
jgi:MoxR-like ATPase